MGSQPTSEIYPACFCRAQAGVGGLVLDGEENLGPLTPPQASQLQPRSLRTSLFSKLPGLAPSRCRPW